MFSNKISNNNYSNSYSNNKANNYGFSCGKKSVVSTNKSTGIKKPMLFSTKNNNQLKMNSTPSTNSIFGSLNSELNNNINLINRQNRMSNSMFKKKRGCGCRGGR